MIIQPGAIVAFNHTKNLDAATFQQQVHSLVTRLKADKGTRYALMCRSTWHFAIGFVALSCLQRTIVLPSSDRVSGLRACHAEVDAVVTDEPAAYPGFDTVSIPLPATTNSVSDPVEIDTRTVVEFYTSGSSGQPGCIPRTVAMLYQEAMACEQEWGTKLASSVRVVATVPHYHRYGFQLAMLHPLVTGRPFFDHACTTPFALHEVLDQYACAVISSPAFLGHLRQNAVSLPVEQIKAIFSAGAPLATEVSTRLNRWLGQSPVDIYGSTETGVIATRQWSPGEPIAKWRPLKCLHITLRAEDAGDRLWVQGPQTGDWIATGDQAMVDGSGRFVLKGRMDSVVKVADKRVSLDAMRARLITHSWVSDVRLLLLPEGHHPLAAVVVLDPGGCKKLAEEGRRVVSDALKHWLHENFERVVLPRKWRFVEKWPDHAMSKVPRDYLLGLFKELT